MSAVDTGATTTTRGGRPEDLAGLCALEALAMGDEAWSASQVAEELADGARRVVRVTVEHGTPIAWVDLAVAGDSADLLRLAVHPHHRRRGHGRQLVRDGLAQLPPHVERVLLEVASANERARATYAAAGFRQIARRAGYYRDGDDALVMERVVEQVHRSDATGADDG